MGTVDSVASGGLSGPVEDELLRLDPSRVRVVGGQAAISDTVIDAVLQALPAADVSRLAGATRYETAVAVSQEAFPAGADVVYLVTGENFPDALSAVANQLADYVVTP